MRERKDNLYNAFNKGAKKEQPRPEGRKRNTDGTGTGLYRRGWPIGGKNGRN